MKIWFDLDLTAKQADDVAMEIADYLIHVEQQTILDYGVEK